MVKDARDPLEIVKEKNWVRIVDKDALQIICNELASKHVEKVYIKTKKRKKKSFLKLIHYCLFRRML